MAAHPRRIAYCEGNTDGTIGGSYYSLLFLIESLDRTRFEPLVVFRDRNALLPRFEAVSEVFVLPLRPALKHRWSPLRKALNAFRFAQTTVEQALFLARHRVDVVHLNNSVTRNHDWMVAALLARVPCVTHERGIHTTLPRLAKILGPRLHAVLCISEAARNGLAGSGLTGAQLHVVHNGLDPSRVIPTCTAERFLQMHGIGPHRRVIGMVGNIKAWKGQDVLIQALPAIVERFPDLLCLFVGATAPSDTPYAQRLIALIRQLGLQAHVVFTGYHPNAADAINVMEVAVHASTDPEPFGRVLLEAMALKRPIVASRGGAVTEIVVDGVTGYTFTPGDSAELAARVIALLESTPKCLAFGEAGFRRLQEEFHQRRNAESTMNIYSRLLRRSGSAEDAA